MIFHVTELLISCCIHVYRCNNTQISLFALPFLSYCPSLFHMEKAILPLSHHVADHGNGKEKVRTSSFLYKDETYKLHRPVPFASHWPEPSHTASFRYKERWEIYSLASFHVPFKNKKGEWEWGMMVGFYRETVLCCMPLRSTAK